MAAGGAGNVTADHKHAQGVREKDIYTLLTLITLIYRRHSQKARSMTAYPKHNTPTQFQPETGNLLTHGL